MPSRRVRGTVEFYCDLRYSRTSPYMPLSTSSRLFQK